MKNCETQITNTTAETKYAVVWVDESVEGGRPAMEHEYAVNFRANQAMVDIVREKVNHAISLVQQLCKC